MKKISATLVAAILLLSAAPLFLDGDETAFTASVSLVLIVALAAVCDRAEKKSRMNDGHTKNDGI